MAQIRPAFLSPGLAGIFSFLFSLFPDASLYHHHLPEWPRPLSYFPAILKVLPVPTRYWPRLVSLPLGIPSSCPPKIWVYRHAQVPVTLAVFFRLPIPLVPSQCFQTLPYVLQFLFRRSLTRPTVSCTQQPLPVPSDKPIQLHGPSYE